MDFAAASVDVEKDIQDGNISPKLNSSQYWAVSLNHRWEQARRWKAYLMSDGTWETEFGEHRPYPIEYILPFSYRGAFRVRWNVPERSPLLILNGKAEAYIPANGVFATSSEGPGPEFSFSFERNGERITIPVYTFDQDEIGVFQIGISCREENIRCYDYFVGSRKEWHALQSKDHSHFVMGSTAAALDLVPRGTPMADLKEFRGITLNGRAVSLTRDSIGRTSWRYIEPETSVPNASDITKDLEGYVKTLAGSDSLPKIEQLGGDIEQLKSLVKLSRLGSFRLVRLPYSTNIQAELLFDKERHPALRGNVYDGLIFLRQPSGWKLVAGHFEDARKDPKKPVAADTLDSNITEFSGEATAEGGVTVWLRQDGTWDLDTENVSNSSLLKPGIYIGRDVNGNKLELELTVDGRRTWRQTESSQATYETVLRDLNHALDRYIELLAVNKVQQYVEESEASELAPMDEELVKKQTVDQQHELASLVRHLVAVDVGKTDGPATLNAFRWFRTQMPVIRRQRFSKKFFAEYQPEPTDLEPPNTAKILTGSGSSWIPICLGSRPIPGACLPLPEEGDE
ncbi:MAG TPA: hypothetical protein VKZ53_23505 [Candidatus Angelobacter sp.]|nr:hypothetical protein [Candidatus Angelobacter sp.]